MLPLMRLPVRVLGAVSITIACVGVATPLHAQLPDLGGGDGGGGGGIDLNLPVDPGNLPGDLGNLPGNAGGGVGGGSGLSLPGEPRLQAPNVVVIDQAAAVKAVQDHRALPLNDVLASATRTYPGKVIDVQLVRSQQTLLYQVKVIDRGTVTLVYFDASTG